MSKINLCNPSYSKYVAIDAYPYCLSVISKTNAITFIIALNMLNVDSVDQVEAQPDCGPGSEIGTG